MPASSSTHCSSVSLSSLRHIAWLILYLPPIRSAPYAPAQLGSVAMVGIARRAQSIGVGEMPVECMRELQAVWIPEGLEPQPRQRWVKDSLPSPSKA